MNKNKSIDILLGVAIGDALGVPVEFKSRTYLQKNPVTDMIGFGTHKQPAGTWSDDSALTFCLAEALIDGYTVEKSANYLLKWYTENVCRQSNLNFSLRSVLVNSKLIYFSDISI